MSIISLTNRIKNKIASIYRHAVFKDFIKCKHKKFNLVGNITMINKNVKIGRNVTFYPNVMLFGDGPIIIGDNVDIGNNVIIYASKDGGGVTIGKNTMIAANCYIIDADHGTEKDRLMREQNNSVEEITIGEDVWLATDVKVLKGSNIKDGAVIGAGSLVKGTVPKNAICVGTPVKIIKYRE